MSPLIAAVILIAVTMSIAGILSFWVSGYMKTKLGESENATKETGCLGADFKIHSIDFNNDTRSLYIVLDNRRAVDLIIENVYFFYPDNKIDTKTLNEELKGNDIKPINITGVDEGFLSGKIKTNCPEISLDFEPPG